MRVVGIFLRPSTEAEESIQGQHASYKCAKLVFD